MAQDILPSIYWLPWRYLQVVTERTDIALVTRLQSKVKDLERQRSHLRRELENREVDSGGSDPEKEIFETIKVDICEKMRRE